MNHPSLLTTAPFAVLLCVIFVYTLGGCPDEDPVNDDTSQPADGGTETPAPAPSEPPAAAPGDGDGDGDGEAACQAEVKALAECMAAQEVK